MDASELGIRHRISEMHYAETGSDDASQILHKASHSSFLPSFEVCEDYIQATRCISTFARFRSRDTVSEAMHPIGAKVSQHLRADRDSAVTPRR
jgi:hypothetical protein